MFLDDGLSSKGVTILFVVMIVIGAVMMYAMVNLLQSANPSPYDHSHEYDVVGTLDGESCTGAGSSKYAPENANCHLYRFDMEVSTAGGASEKLNFGMLFDKDGTVNESMYTFLRSETYEGQELDVWKYVESGSTYTFHVGEYCHVMRVDVESEDCVLTATVR